MTDDGGGSDACGGELAATAGQELAREIRCLAGLSQADLAAAIGYSRQYMSTEDALRRADEAREEVAGPDELGGMMAFPLPKQTFYTATARLWLGGRSNLREAEQLAEESVDQYRLADPEDQRLGELALARLDLAAARLARTDLDGAAEQVQEVLEVVARRPTDSVRRRLRQVATTLERPVYQTSALALDLRDRVTTSCGPATRSLPRGGQ